MKERGVFTLVDGLQGYFMARREGTQTSENMCQLAAPSEGRSHVTHRLKTRFGRYKKMRGVSAVVIAPGG